jgi:hypothetical protein
MGQRFTLDAYVFGQLIWRKVGTEQNPRGLPKGLDFMAAVGSEEAYNILKEIGENEYANYDTQMAKVRKEIGSLQTDSWTQNLYWSWLYALQPLLEPKDTRPWVHADSGLDAQRPAHCARLVDGAQA